MAGKYSIETVFKAIDQMTGPISKMEARIGKMNDKIKSLSTTAMGIGAAVLGAMAGPVKIAMDFEATMSKVGAVAKASKEDLAKLTATARELGATTVWSATQAAEGMTYLSMAGFKTNEVIEAMPGMLSLASAGGLELASAADIASNILTGFNLKAKDLNKVADVMTNTFTTSNTNVEMLGETMKYVAPVASALGVSLETTAGMTAKLGDAGIQASMAGTALRAIMSRIAAPPKSAEKALKKIGVNAKDAKGNLRDLPTIIEEIYKKTKNMGNAARQGIFKDIAGEEAASALTVLAEQAGTGALKKYIGTLGEVGSASRVAKEMNDNAKGAMNEFKSAVEEMAITIGNVLLPVITEYLQKGAELLLGVQAWAKEHPELVDWIVKTATALGLLLVIVGAAMLGFTLISGPMLMIAKGFGIITAAVRLLTLAMMANPIISIITVVIGLAALLIANWDKVGPFFTKMWEGIKAAFSAAGEWISGIMDAILGRIMGAIEAVKNFASGVKSFFSGGGIGSGGGGAGYVPSAVSSGAAQAMNSTTTQKSEVTIMDQTGRAKVTKGPISSGVFLQKSGGF